MAGRTLITEDAVRAVIHTGARQMVVPADALITPLARDTAQQHGVRFVEEVLQTPDPTAPPGRIVIGSDHGGFAFKGPIADVLKSLGLHVEDVGTFSEKSCDYPDYAYQVAQQVAHGLADLGIMIDGAGIGSAMVCNKVPGIRAAVAYNEFTAWNARAHNNANVLTLGSRSLGIEVAKRIVRVFLDTPFEGGRHQNRVAKITQIEHRSR